MKQLTSDTANSQQDLLDERPVIEDFCTSTNCELRRAALQQPDDHSMAAVTIGVNLGFTVTPAVICDIPAPVTEYVALSPETGYMAPLPAGTHAGFTAAVTTEINLDTTGTQFKESELYSQCPTLFHYLNVRWKERGQGDAKHVCSRRDRRTRGNISATSLMRIPVRTAN